MATWKKTDILLDNGEVHEAIKPLIISASRSTDIPAFYADWFFNRLQIGYSAWYNPFNGVKSYISFQDTRFVVFWSKDPSPLLTHLDELIDRKIGCYIQYTLNDYVKEGFEKGLKPLEYRIDTFKRLVDKLGYGSVIWRFDPLILTDTVDIDKLLGKIENIGEQLKGYTEKLVFSYADIAVYRKVKSNLEKNGINSRDWTENEMRELAGGLVKLNRSWGYTLATCCEKINLQSYGIKHNRCVDDALIIKLAYQDKVLMDFLKVKIHPMPSPSIFGDTEPLPTNAIILPNNTYATYGDNSDKGQREFCGCMKSKDIGEYNTCPHLCEYCYANSSKEIAVANWMLHQKNKLSDTITGK